MMPTMAAMRRTAALFIVAYIAAGGLLAWPAHAGALIKWQLENPFRFFTDPADTEVHRATYRALSAEEKATPVLSAERALERRHDDGWAVSMYRKTCWDWKRNRFKCPAYDDYMNPTSHAVSIAIDGIEDAANLSCTWLTAPKGGGDVRGIVVTQPCNETLRIEVPYPKGTSVKVEIGGLQVAAEEIKVRDILVAAMGDSYASGEGNPDIPVRFSRDRSADYGTVSDDGRRAGYPARIGNWQTIGDKTFIAENARWLDQACHRSLYSQQLRAALQLAVEDPHRAVTFVGVACSGAEVSWGLFLRYKGNEWVPNPPLLSQISAVAEAQCGTKETSALDLPEAYHINGQIPELKGGLVLRKCGRENAREIDLVLLSVGGNDIGFSRLIANAVLSDASLLRELGGWLGEVHGETEASAQLTRLDARYKSLNRAIHSLLYVPWSESDRIILTAYPGLALTGDGSETCKDGRAGLDVLPDFQLSEQKLRIGTWIADKLHRQMRKSALSYGWTFVETHRRQFIGRSICSGVTIDGATSNDELRIPRKIDNKWVPYNPVDYKPYATRQRWFRTPNDAFMTGNFHVAASLLNKVLKLDTLAWFQLVLASTYSGAFHPTAEGHAAIADAVVEKARVVLAKYGQGTTSGSAPYGVSADDAPPPPVDEPGVQMPDINSVLSSPAPATPQTPPTESPPAAAAPVPEPTPAAVAPETMPPPVPETSPMPPLPEERSSGTQHSDPAAAGFPAGNDEGAAAPMSGDADWQATPSPAPQPLPAQEPAVGAPDDASGWQSSPSPPAPQPDAEPGLKPFAPASEAPRAKFETAPGAEPAVDAEGGSRLR